MTHWTAPHTALCCICHTACRAVQFSVSVLCAAEPVTATRFGSQVFGFSTLVSNRASAWRRARDEAWRRVGVVRASPARAHTLLVGTKPRGGFAGDKQWGRMCEDVAAFARSLRGCEVHTVCSDPGDMSFDQQARAPWTHSNLAAAGWVLRGY